MKKRRAEKRRDTRATSTTAPPSAAAEPADATGLAVAALRPKHARFVQEYLVDLNATQAAIRAGYSAKTADREGYRLLRNAEISAAVREGQRAQWAKAELSASRVLEELHRVSLVNIRGLFQADGQLKPMTEWSDEQLAVVASVDIVTVDREGAPPARVHKLRLWNKVAALDTLAKHFELLKERIEVDAPQPVQDIYHELCKLGRRRSSRAASRSPNVADQRRASAPAMGSAGSRSLPAPPRQPPSHAWTAGRRYTGIRRRTASRNRSQDHRAASHQLDNRSPAFHCRHSRRQASRYPTRRRNSIRKWLASPRSLPLPRTKRQCQRSW
jgi:phage terminase small subunit